MISVTAWAAGGSLQTQTPPKNPQERLGKLKVGDVAPDFKLKTADGKKEVSLSEYRDKMPVALVFGCYTCPPFRGQVPAVNKLAEKHKDNVAFLLVYVLEAHPEDGWQVPQNTKEGIIYKQPKTLEERTSIAQTCGSKLDIHFPIVIDTMKNSTEQAYSGWPSRFYIIDKNGKIAYKGGPGPFGFKPDEMGKELEKMLGK